MRCYTFRFPAIAHSELRGFRRLEPPTLIMKRTTSLSVIASLALASLAFGQSPDGQLSAKDKPPMAPKQGGSSGPQKAPPVGAQSTAATAASRRPDVPVATQAAAKDAIIPGAGEAQGNPAAPLPPAPITFEPAILNLGEMQAEVAKTGKIGLRNTSDQPVKVTKAVPGCGCTTAGAPKDPIPPGGIAEVEITLKPGPKQGLHLSKKVTFQVEGFAPTVLTVEGDVAAYVTCVPDVIQAPAPGQTVDTEIKLSSADGTPFKVTACIPEVLESVPQDAATDHVLKLDWNKWESNGRAVKLSIRTDHPKASALTLLVKRALNPNAKEPKPPAQDPRRSSEPTSPFITAARSGDLAAVQLQIANGADVNQIDPSTGRTALHWAANQGRVDVIAILAEKGANLEVPERTGKTALALAAEAKQLDATLKLVALGADLNHRDQMAGTALTWASGLGSPETVAALLEAGADVNVIDTNGMTPVLWAAGIGNPQTVQLLVDKGADLKQVDSISGDTALTRASRHALPQTVEILIAAGSDVNATNREGMTALLLAAQAGSIEKVQALVKAGADRTVKTRSGMDVIAVAKGRGDEKGKAVAEWLAAQGN